MIQKYATLIAFLQIVLNFDKNRQKIDFSESYRFPGLNREIDLASLLSSQLYFWPTLSCELTFGPPYTYDDL